MESRNLSYNRTYNLNNVPAMLSTSGNVTSTEVLMFNILPKKCYICGEWKSRSEFHKNKSRGDGLAAECKLCHSQRNHAYQKGNSKEIYERRQKVIDREKERERGKKYYYDNHQKELERQRKRRETEKGRKRRSTYCKVNREHLLEMCRNYRKSHLAEKREANRARRAAKRGNGGSFTAQEWETLKRKYNYTCLRCGQQEPKIQLTHDHVLPVTMGGTSSIDNIQPLCGPCNSSKGKKHIDYRERSL